MGEATEKRGSFLHRVVDGIEWFIDEGQVALTLVAAGLLLLLQIPGLNELIPIDSDTQLRTAIVILILMSILLEVRLLKRRVTPAISGRQQYPDPQTMYGALKDELGTISASSQREIKVLGLTLYSAWPVLSNFLETPEVRGWKVSLATLATDATASPLWVPDGWPRESETTVNQVVEFKERKGREHEHEIEVFEYQFPPAVHGFYLGNGDYFVSTMQWEEGHLCRHRFSYDYVPAHDVSAGAAAVRELFDNWFEQAVHGAAEAPADGGGLGPAQGADPE